MTQSVHHIWDISLSEHSQSKCYWMSFTFPCPILYQYMYADHIMMHFLENNIMCRPTTVPLDLIRHRSRVNWMTTIKAKLRHMTLNNLQGLSVTNLWGKQKTWKLFVQKRISFTTWTWKNTPNDKDNMEKAGLFCRWRVRIWNICHHQVGLSCLRKAERSCVHLHHKIKMSSYKLRPTGEAWDNFLQLGRVNPVLSRDLQN